MNTAGESSKQESNDQTMSAATLQAAPTTKDSTICNVPCQTDEQKCQSANNARETGGKRSNNNERKGRGQWHKREVGRSERRRNVGDKRAHDGGQDESNKRSRQREPSHATELPAYATKFPTEEIAAQERQPKRKVAVMIGYSGSGYKGMQLNAREKTIEGDLFAAFVAAGAISKANADDPKKSSLMRCARTDKGVHAAGNLISLKLIVEDPDIVEKINAALSPQIRVWGIERTNSSFSAYKMCDSRIYEYLIPSYCFLPPNPSSFLGNQIEQIAREDGEEQSYRERLDDTADFWSQVESNLLSPILERLDPELRSDVLAYMGNDADGVTETNPTKDKSIETNGLADPARKRYGERDAAIKALKTASMQAKKDYRISSPRLARVKSTFSRYQGTHKFHNYTIDKQFRDPSATRVIRSFVVDPKPVVIGDTEWISLKVHGQSFMMHQIRKMVCAAALIIRCGCHEGRLQDTYLAARLSIPKAPSLGLLLERPVFDAYNEKLAEFGRERIDFSRVSAAIDEFKQREIYQRIFREEEKDGIFLNFFSGLDSTRSASLLWATSLGFEGTSRKIDDIDAAVGASRSLKDIEGADERGGDDDGS